MALYDPNKQHYKGFYGKGGMVLGDHLNHPGAYGRDWGPRRRREQGAVAVELALLMPLFLLVVAAVIDFGLLFWEQAVLTNAVREGARAAAKAADQGFGPAAELTQTQVREVVQNYLNRFGLKNLEGQALTLDAGNFSYTWTDTGSGIYLTVVLQRVPYRLMLLPAARSLFREGAPDDGLVYLSSRITMAAEWTSPPGP